jgi:hypothetical protein
MQLCHRLLPRDWGSEEASVLCEDTTGRDQVEAALRCAVEASARYCTVCAKCVWYATRAFVCIAVVVVLRVRLGTSSS